MDLLKMEWVRLNSARTRHFAAVNMEQQLIYPHRSVDCRIAICGIVGNANREQDRQEFNGYGNKIPARMIDPATYPACRNCIKKLAEAMAYVTPETVNGKPWPLQRGYKWFDREFRSLVDERSKRRAEASERAYTRTLSQKEQKARKARKVGVNVGP